jgi:hypothetical protein
MMASPFSSTVFDGILGGSDRSPRLRLTPRALKNNILVPICEPREKDDSRCGDYAIVEPVAQRSVREGEGQ